MLLPTNTDPRPQHASDSLRFVRFLGAGAAAAVANFGSRFLFSMWLSYEWAIVCAFGVGLFAGFILMRHYVFDAKGRPIGRQIATYLAVNALALVQTLIVSLVLARWVLPAIDAREHAEAVAHAFGVAVPIVSSYILHRVATFR